MLVNRIFSKVGVQSLKGRLRFGFICYIVLLILLASTPAVFIGKKYMQESAYSEIEKTIDLQQLVIENWFEDRIAEINFISELPTVKAKDLKSMEVALEAFDKTHSEFNGIVYVNKEGISEIDTTGDTGLDLSDRIYYQEAKKGNSFITDVLIGRQSKKPIIIFSAPVYGFDGTFQGLVFGPVPITTINDVMGEYQDDSRETYIVDKNGMLISDSRQDTIGQTIDTEIFKQAIEGRQITNFYANQNQEKVLGDYRWVHNNQWLIIGEITEKKVFEIFNRMAMILSIVLLLLVVVGYRMLMIIAKQLEVPINRVLEGTREIGTGNLEYRIDSSLYKYETIERKELSDNFNKMADLLDAHIETISANEERFRMIAEYSSDMITIHDAAGKYLYVSPAGKEILQYEDHEFVGYDGYLFIHPDDLEMISKNHEILLDKGYVVSTYRIRRKDGEYIWFESSIKCFKGEKPDELQLVCISRNITERKLVEQKLQEANDILRELSTKDGLTGVWNRRTFDERLEVEWNRAIENSAPLSMIMFDIDHFKAFNDTYGHQAGDDCLREVASVVLEIVKKSGDMVFRYGGEEFSVILPGTNLVEAKNVAETIRKAVENLAIPHSFSKFNQCVTISLGMNTTIPDNERSIEQFIKESDKALYEAKRDGRNCVRINDCESMTCSTM